MQTATKTDSRNGVVSREAIEEALPEMDQDQRRSRRGGAGSAEQSSASVKVRSSIRSGSRSGRPWKHTGTAQTRACAPRQSGAPHCRCRSHAPQTALPLPLCRVPGTSNARYEILGKPWVARAQVRTGLSTPS